LCLSDLRRSGPCKFWASQIFACSPRYAASYPLPVRQASALPSASSGFAVARDTLAVRLALLLAECVEDFHLQVRAPCRAHKRKRPRAGAVILSRWWRWRESNSRPEALHSRDYMLSRAIWISFPPPPTDGLRANQPPCFSAT